MLESLLLEDFQTHKKKKLRFDRVTSIIGPTDRGKSSIIRALRLACLNQPRGEGFIRHGRKQCRVTLRVDGRKVVRSRGTSGNLYLLGNATFKAFGVGKVPQPIQDVLRVGEINFQDQHDAPFWLTETPGQVSKKLNQIVNLGLIDQTLAAVATEVRRSRAEVEVSQRRLTEAKEARDQMNWVQEFAEDVKRLNALFDRLALKSHRIASLRLCLLDASRVKLARDRSLNANVDAQKLVKAGRLACESRDKADGLSKLVRTARKTRRLVKAIVPDTTELVATRKEADKVAEDCRVLEELVEQARKAKEKVCRLRKQLEKKSKQLPKNCPKCGKVLSPPSSPGVTYTSHKNHR